jgi:hypothetical protein
MCRPSGAWKDRGPYPTASAVGYDVTFLRDFQQHEDRAPHIRGVRIFARDQLLAGDNLIFINICMPTCTMRNLTLRHSAHSILLGGKRCVVFKVPEESGKARMEGLLLGLPAA